MIRRIIRFNVMKKVLRMHRRPLTIISLCLIAVAAGIIFPLQLYLPKAASATANPASNTATENQAATGDLRKGTPTYQTILPKGTTAATYGGWTRVSPPNRNAVYAYSDTIGKIPISVSEQPLPADLKEDTAEGLRDLAYNFAATKHFNAGGITVYVGVSSRGPQSVIFTKSGLLILIKAAASLSDDDWQAYISNLQ
jgi:hypothetical protein